jgi:PAS domain S-box-containing protein
MVHSIHWWTAAWPGWSDGIVKRGDSEEPAAASQGLFELHQTLDAVSTFLYVKDRERRVVSANRAFCEALGITREHLLGRTTHELLGDAGPASDQVDREVLESGLPRLGFIESYPTSSGRRWVVTDKAPIRSPDGSVIGLLGASSDITEQVEAQERLRQSEAQFRFLTAHMADILWTMDLGFHTTYVSPSIERILGFTPEERSRQTLEQMATPESVDRILAELRRQLDLEASGLAAPERAITIEVEYYHKNGSTVWTENIVSPLRNTDGMLTGIFGVSRDITARRQAEQAAKESERLLHETEYLSHLGGWSYDPQTRLMVWTDGTFAVH